MLTDLNSICSSLKGIEEVVTLTASMCAELAVQKTISAEGELVAACGYECGMKEFSTNAFIMLTVQEAEEGLQATERSRKNTANL